MDTNSSKDPFDISVVIESLDFDGRPLFRDLRLDIPGGKWTCLLGASGVGKTTLLRLTAGLLDDTSTAQISSSDGLSLHNRLAYMAQQDLLMPWLSVIDNVLIGARLRGEALSPQMLERARYLLDRVGLAANADDLPATLSGGMRQRAALARTLMEDQPVVLMDEPFSALDVITRMHLQDMSAELLRGRTILLVTHDPLEALRLGHRIHVLSGRPAVLDESMEFPGETPRDIQNAELLASQADLLHRLQTSAAEAAA